MPSLLDLAPITQTVRIRGLDFVVNPLQLIDVANFLKRHKGLAASLLGDGDANGSVDVLDVLTLAGDVALNELIDAGLAAKPGTAAKAHLTGLERTNLAMAVIDATLPLDQEELADFLARLVRLLGRTGAVVAAPASIPGSVSSSS